MTAATGILATAVTALLALSYAIASTAGLLATAVMVTVLVVLGGRASLSDGEPSPGLRTARGSDRPQFPTYRGLVSAVASAGTSRRAWDREMRPVLVRLLGVELVERFGADLAHRPDVGRQVFGDDLWPLIDPGRPRSDDRDTPGPPRSVLELILDRLEVRDDAG